MDQAAVSFLLFVMEDLHEVDPWTLNVLERLVELVAMVLPLLAEITGKSEEVEEGRHIQLIGGDERSLFRIHRFV